MTNYENLSLKLKTYASIGAIYVGMTLVTAIPVNATLYGLQAGYELTQNSEKKKFDAVYKGKRELLMLGTQGKLLKGEFQLQDGSKVVIYDSIRVLEGKLFNNTMLPTLNEGKKYNLEVITSETFGTKTNNILNVILVK